MTDPTTGSRTPIAAARSDRTATKGTPIRVTIGDVVLPGRLWDNATANGLMALIPLTLNFSDFNDLEKIARLPLELSLDGVPAGDDPAPRDIGYSPRRATSSSTTAMSATSRASYGSVGSMATWTSSPIRRTTSPRRSNSRTRGLR